MAANSADCSEPTVCIWSRRSNRATTSLVGRVWSALIWMAGIIFKMLHILLVFAAAYAVYKNIVSIDIHHTFLRLTKTKDMQDPYSFFTPLTANPTSPIPTPVMSTALTATRAVKATLHPYRVDHRGATLTNTRKPTASITDHEGKNFVLVGYEAQTMGRGIKKTKRSGQTKEENNDGEDEKEDEKGEDEKAKDEKGEDDEGEDDEIDEGDGKDSESIGSY